jgi:hypothetical protein
MLNLVEIKRDNYGQWTHPTFQEFIGDREGLTLNEFNSFMNEHNLESCILHLETDNLVLADKYFAHGELDISDWNPNKPSGEGWFILSIHDTDDGPVCIFVREKQ